MTYRVLQLEQGSEEWKAERRKWATASDLPSILGVPGAYRSRDAVLREKVSGKEEEISGFKAALFAEGHEAEATIRASAEAAFKLPLTPAVVLNEKLGILASLDGMNAEAGIIAEYKYSGAKDVAAAREKEQVPERYRIQVMAQMLATGFRKGYAFVFDNKDGQVYAHKIEWCDATAERIAEAAKKFLADMKVGRTNEIEITDQRMGRLYQLLNRKKDIEHELAAPLSLLKAVESEIDTYKKAVAEEFAHSIIRGSGVEISKSKPAESFDRSAAESAGVDLSRFMKRSKAAVRVKLLEEV